MPEVRAIKAAMRGYQQALPLIASLQGWYAVFIQVIRIKIA